MTLRILHLTTSYPSSPSDISGPFVHRLVLAEIKLDLVCTVLTPSGIQCATWPNNYNVIRFRYAPWYWQRLAQQPGGIPTALAEQPLLYGLLPPFLSSMALSLIKLAKRNDIIHAHWSACGAVAILTQPIHRKPVVTTLRGSDIHKAKKLGPFSWLHNKSLKGSSFTIGVSQAITNELKRQNPDMTEKIKFVSDGADDVFYAVPRNRQSVSVSPFKLLFIGSLIPRKGLDVLLKALAISKTDFPWMLTVVGSGPEKGYLSSLAAILGIDANVHFLGNVSPAQIAELMGDHHLFILPSYLEGRPSVVHEAMAAAMPVLATDIDGTRELVTNSEAGWLVPPGAENALSIALDDIIKGKRDLKAAGLAGRKWMLEHELTWNNTAKQYNQLYEEAIQSFKRTKP